MALNKITYEDKVALNPQPSVANKNKVSDADMNEIKAVVNQVVEDTGWIDMSSYVNTSNFTIRSGQPPMARRIGKVVYWKGSVYCSTAVNNKEATILSGIPTQFRPTGEFGRCGITWYISTPYHIFADNTGAVRVSESSNIEVQNDWAGFTLANISGYLVD